MKGITDTPLTNSVDRYSEISVDTAEKMPRLNRFRGRRIICTIGCITLLPKYKTVASITMLVRFSRIRPFNVKVTK